MIATDQFILDWNFQYQPEGAPTHLFERDIVVCVEISGEYPEIDGWRIVEIGAEYWEDGRPDQRRIGYFNNDDPVVAVMSAQLKGRDFQAFDELVRERAYQRAKEVA